MCTYIYIYIYTCILVRSYQNGPVVLLCPVIDIYRMSHRVFNREARRRPRAGRAAALARRPRGEERSPSPIFAAED